LLRDALVQRDEELVDAQRPVCTAEEFGGYVWVPGKEQPVKVDDHGMDCVRYLVAQLDAGGRPRVRWMG
jgi:phage terminase large subunit